jgi:hypothetical protein
MEEKMIKCKFNCLLKQAIEEFYAKDSKLVKKGGTERACVAKIFYYLQNLIITMGNDFAGLNLDCEYNKNGEETKTILYEDGKHRIQPDMLLHSSGNAMHNVAAVEFKGWWSKESREHDAKKLKALTNPSGQYAYKIGIFVCLGKSFEKVEYKYFLNGEVISETELQTIMK